MMLMKSVGSVRSNIEKDEQLQLSHSRSPTAAHDAHHASAPATVRARLVGSLPSERWT